ncbi:MAG: (Fe-S)-binding protein [Cyclobacteriaceae bacterium]|nr:(Fe-S)-binding protein [Cyclobacteriaceae bacterium]
MKVALFIPCYINQLYPQVGIATYRLLQQLGFDVHYPIDQTCCGQPLGNSGFETNTGKALQHFEKVFKGYDCIVAPSASCVLYVKEHHDNPGNVLELSEFLLRYVDLSTLELSYKARVGILSSCHGLRGLELAKPSELVLERVSTLKSILSHIQQLELIELDRPDDCCGFGGTFSIKEPELSVKMGCDRLDDFVKNKAEIITGTDVSCLMHLDGIIRHQKLPLQVKHFAELLNPI